MLEFNKENIGMVVAGCGDSLKGDIMLLNALEKWENVAIVAAGYGNSLKSCIVHCASAFANWNLIT